MIAHILQGLVVVLVVIESYTLSAWLSTVLHLLTSTRLIVYVLYLPLSTVCIRLVEVTLQLVATYARRERIALYGV